MQVYNSEALINDLLLHATEIENTVKSLNKRIKDAPMGSLRILKKRKSYQYYQRVRAYDNSGRYIAAKDRDLAAKLAQKDYDQKLLAVLKEQKKTIEQFLKDFDPDAARQVYEKLKEPRKQLVKSEFLSDEEFIERWQNTPYTRLGFGKKAPEFYTTRGERVRSKSEILIADALLRNNIPYRYEYPVTHDGVIFAAPDFNCLNVRLRKDYYWEHLGMMGKEDYTERNVSKIDKYVLADDFDIKSLILTMETEAHPLNTKVIEEMIKRYLI